MTKKDVLEIRNMICFTKRRNKSTLVLSQGREVVKVKSVYPVISLESHLKYLQTTKTR